MRRVFGATGGWVCISKRFRLVRTRSFCNNNKPTPTATTTTNNNNNGKLDGSVSSYDDAYRKLDNLDLMTAAKILFTTPPKKKKFGIDFHLVQLFFVCMPSLAVYLVAQYARYEMRRMEAELEQKKKAEEAAKAKEMELKATEEKEAKSDPELSEVRVRLDKLEEVVKEIVVESKKQMGSTIMSRQEDGSEKKHPETTEPINTQNGSEASSGAKDHYSNQAANNITEGSGQGKVSGLAPFTDASQQNQKGNQNAGPSQGAKK